MLCIEGYTKHADRERHFEKFKSIISVKNLGSRLILSKYLELELINMSQYTSTVF